MLEVMEDLISKICLTDAINDCVSGDCKDCSACDSDLRVLVAEYTTKVREDAIDECINSLGMVLDNENIKRELRHLFETLKENY